MERIIQNEVFQCEKCGRKLDRFSFYHYKKSEDRFHICKDCILSQLDIHDTNTFFWVLQELDIPFIEDEWNGIVEKFNNKTVLGRYISKMYLRGYRGYNWEDSDKLNSWAREQRIKSEMKKRVKFIPPPEPDKIILVKMDLDDRPLDESLELHQAIAAQFPNNKVVTIPLDAQLHYFDEDEIRDIIKNLEASLGNNK